MPKIEELHRSQQPTCPRVWQARILKSKMNSGIGATSTHGDKHVHRSGRRQNFKIKNWGTSSSCMYVEPPIQDTIFITLVYPPCTQCSDYVTSVYPLPEDARRHHHRLTRDSMNESPPCCACVDGRVSMMNLPSKETEIEAGSKQNSCVWISCIGERHSYNVGAPLFFGNKGFIHSLYPTVLFAYTRTSRFLLNYNFPSTKK